MRASGLISLVLALLLSPLLSGIVNRVKAFFAGRRGSPLLQLYHDLFKLLRKGAVFSRTTTWVFRASPSLGLAAAILSAAIVPLAGPGALLGFQGDLILLAYALGLLRFFTVSAALDTGSSFEGMGASREVQFSALSEPALLLGLAAVAALTGSLSLQSMYNRLDLSLWLQAAPSLVLICTGFFVVFLVENARIPVDDPNTHLELTMIHEVMVLDHSGPDLALIQYTAALKLWVLGCLITGVGVPFRSGGLWPDTLISLGALAALAAGVGVIESSMARLKLLSVPRLLLGASVFMALALILVLR
ncbi:NADH-quinone oxidoreductase subunit H [bacterium]|nr:NADH-quinone oxidoreductase subunit H [bacterium]